ncbi:MAG: riboflavin kinase, partial [Candidatus Omnitrophica bacterium]|nr:riboflavin kinase [Candidatus Omnitrophota bacterium]
MKTLYGYRNTADTLVSPVAAIGIFDGIHIGHKRVIGKVLSCRGHAGDRILITFDPHPQSVLRPDKTPPRIMSLDHRLSIFSKMGLDAVIVIRFTDYLAMMPPEEFVKNVLGTIGAKKVFVGSNFRFGRGRSGDAKMLKSIGASLGVDVQIVPPLMYGRKAVSSTWLRKLIKEGRLAKAEKLLRRPVSVYGTVIRGDERGRRLGTPTANIDPHQEVIP